MKKYLLVLVCLVLLVTGCGKKNQVVCTGTQEENGITLKAEIAADLDDNNKVTDATVIYDLGSEETANQYCSLFKLMEDADKGITIECKGTKVTINGFAKITSDDEDEEDEDEKLLGATKEKFIEIMEQQNMTCK